MGFINTVKNFIGMETDEYYDDEYYDDNEVDDEAPRASMHTFPKRTSKVVPMSSANQSRVRIMRPENFDASTKVADEVKAGRMVIFDVGKLDDEEEARRTVDFVAGAVYGIDGNIRRVSGGIFVAAPRNIDITGDNVKEQARNSFDWSM